MTRLRPLLIVTAIALTAGAAAAQSTFRRNVPDAVAQPTEAERASVLQAVIDCRAQTDSAARLACYDTAAARLQQAESAGEVVVVDRGQVREARRQIFGFSVPALDLFGGRGGQPRPEDRVDEVTTTLTSSSVGRDGHRTFRLENGQIWRQYGSEEITVRAGAPVRLTRGVIGSYFMSVGGRSGFRVQRVQ